MALRELVYSIPVRYHPEQRIRERELECGVRQWRGQRPPVGDYYTSGNPVRTSALSGCVLCVAWETLIVHTFWKKMWLYLVGYFSFPHTKSKTLQKLILCIYKTKYSWNAPWYDNPSLYITGQLVFQGTFILLYLYFYIFIKKNLQIGFTSVPEIAWSFSNSLGLSFRQFIHCPENSTEDWYEKLIKIERKGTL